MIEYSDGYCALTISDISMLAIKNGFKPEDLCVCEGSSWYAFNDWDILIKHIKTGNCIFSFDPWKGTITYEFKTDKPKYNLKNSKLVPYIVWTNLVHLKKNSIEWAKQYDDSIKWEG